MCQKGMGLLVVLTCVICKVLLHSLSSTTLFCLQLSQILQLQVYNKHVQLKRGAKWQGEEAALSIIQQPVTDRLGVLCARVCDCTRQSGAGSLPGRWCWL